MNVKLLIEKTRDIARAYYTSIKSLEMGDNDPEMSKQDLYSRLKKMLPDVNEGDMNQLLNVLNKKNYVYPITSDKIAFSKTFVWY